MGKLTQVQYETGFNSRPGLYSRNYSIRNPCHLPIINESGLARMLSGLWFTKFESSKLNPLVAPVSGSVAMIVVTWRPMLASIGTPTINHQTFMNH